MAPTRPVPPARDSKSGKTLRQYLRVQQFQQRWENIKEDLPPQLSRSHSELRLMLYALLEGEPNPVPVGMISIGTVATDPPDFAAINGPNKAV